MPRVGESLVLHGQGQMAQMTHPLATDAIAATLCEPLTKGGFETHDPCQPATLPGRPVACGIRQQCVPGQQAQMRRDTAAVQWIVMKGEQSRFVTHAPAALSRPPTQIDVLVIEEERGLESAQFAQHLTAHQQTAAGDPIDLLTGVGRQVVLAPAARQQQPGEGAEQGRERAGRGLPPAIAVAERQADDAGARFVAVEPPRQVEDAIEEAGGDAHVGVEQQHPVALAEPNAFVDRPGESAIAAPAPQRHPLAPAQSRQQPMRRRMIIDEDDLTAACRERDTIAQLIDESGRQFPLAIVDEDDGERRQNGLPWECGSGRNQDRKRGPHGIHPFGSIGLGYG